MKKIIFILSLALSLIAANPIHANETEKSDPPKVDSVWGALKFTGYSIKKGSIYTGQKIKEGSTAAGHGIKKGAHATGQAFKKSGKAVKKFFVGEKN